MPIHFTRNLQKADMPVFRTGQVIKLKELFDRKHWDIDEETEYSLFERYIRTLSYLSEAQQLLIFELTERFLHLPQSTYLNNLIKPIKSLREDYPDDKLVLACCLPKKDKGKVKSSTAVLYHFKGTTIKYKVNLGNHSVIEDFSQDKISTIDINKSHFVLVDDFIGTGETAKGAIDYLHELFPDLKDNSRISILSIVAMQKGVEAIKATGATVYTSTICHRGISDYYDGDELTKAIEIMRSIEKKMKNLQSKFYFGYGHSEALVCMERCPNNTFPIYWLKRNDAPYER